MPVAAPLQEPQRVWPADASDILTWLAEIQRCSVIPWNLKDEHEKVEGWAKDQLVSWVLLNREPDSMPSYSGPTAMKSAFNMYNMAPHSVKLLLDPILEKWKEQIYGKEPAA
jgi:hypothetical protein